MARPLSGLWFQHSCSVLVAAWRVGSLVRDHFRVGLVGDMRVVCGCGWGCDYVCMYAGVVHN